MFVEVKYVCTPGGVSVTIVSADWKTTVIETREPSDQAFGLRVQLNESLS